MSQGADANTPEATAEGDVEAKAGVVGDQANIPGWFKILKFKSSPSKLIRGSLLRIWFVIAGVDEVTGLEAVVQELA